MRILLLRTVTLLGTLIFLGGCAAAVGQYRPLTPPSLPPYLETKMGQADCEMQTDTDGLMRLRCRNNMKLTMTEQVIVGNWVNAVNKRRSLERVIHTTRSAYSGCSGFICFNVRSYPNVITTSKWQRKNYGVPKYVYRGRHGGRTIVHQRWQFTCCY